MSGYRRSFPKGASERMCALMSEARNISELKRAQCIYFRSEHGLPPQQIADMVGFDVGTVRNLHSAFLRDGEAALKLSGQYTYAYGAVSPRDGAADFLILPVMTAVAMKVFLDELARRHDGQYILMIYDGAPCHSPGALNIPDTMTVRTLPPYSPQLNPVENIWDDMREKFFANTVFESMDAVENKISEACLHYEENTETVRSITAFLWIANNL